MEKQPNHRPGAEAGRLHPGEIDFTGALQQPEALRNVTDDANTEAKATESSLVSERDARALARALSNLLKDPLDGALHRFALTGQAEPKELISQLAGIALDAPNSEIHMWADRLGAYVMTLSDEPGLAARPVTGLQPELAPTAETVLPDIPQIRTIRRGTTTPSADTDPGVLTIYQTAFFSRDTRCAVVADFRTDDGAYSQVHRRLRSKEYFVVGAHGNNSRRGVYHPSIEAAVGDALGERA